MFKLTTKKSLNIKKQEQTFVDKFAKTELNTDKIFYMLVDFAKISNTNFDSLMKFDFNKMVSDVFHNLTTKEQKSLKLLASDQNIHLKDYLEYYSNNFGCEDNEYKNAKIKKKAVGKIIDVIDQQ